MQTFKQVLTWLSGKKSAIAASIGLIIAYLATKAIIGDEEVILFSSLNIIIFGGASYATSKLVYNK
jgi:hypothetical protein